MADIFDQNEPKSALAKSLNEAFAGIDGWSVSPRKRRTTLPDDEPIRLRRHRPVSPMNLDAPAWVQESPRKAA